MISQFLIRQAGNLAPEIDASAILVYADAAEHSLTLRRAIEPLKIRTIVLTRYAHSIPKDWNPDITWVSVPNVSMTRTGQIKIGLLICFSRGILKLGERVIFLSGIDGSKSIDTMMVLNLDTESELVSIHSSLSIPGGFQSEVFERTLALAASLAVQGREGHAVGTIFVLGDSDNVLKRSQNLVLNPFFGYPENQRNILDIKLQETIKEFASIDGAFIVRDDGVIMSAGAHLLTDVVLPDLPLGLGTRHASAAGITKVTEAVAFCVSQSTGNLSVFKGGRLVAEIAKPEPVAALAVYHHPT